MGSLRGPPPSPAFGASPNISARTVPPPGWAARQKSPTLFGTGVFHGHGALGRVLVVTAEGLKAALLKRGPARCRFFSPCVAISSRGPGRCPNGGAARNGSVMATEVMSALAFTSSFTRSTSPRVYWPAGSDLLACSTGVTVFLMGSRQTAPSAHRCHDCSVSQGLPVPWWVTSSASLAAPRQRAGRNIVVLQRCPGDAGAKPGGLVSGAAGVGGLRVRPWPSPAVLPPMAALVVPTPRASAGSAEFSRCPHRLAVVVFQAPFCWQLMKPGRCPCRPSGQVVHHGQHQARGVHVAVLHQPPPVGRPARC